MPAATPYQGFCVAKATAAETNAEARILPSRPMSITPERSANRPAMPAKISTGALRTVDTRMLPIWRSSKVMTVSLFPFDQGGDGGGVEVFHRAAEQDDQALDEDEGLRRNVLLFQRQVEAALDQRAEQHGRQEDADWMLPSHQRNRDADEARAADEVQRQVVGRAHDGVDRTQAGQRAGDQHHGDDHLADADARIVRGMLVQAGGAQLETPRGTRHHHAVDHQRDNRQEEADVQRRLAKHREPLVQTRHFGGGTEGAAGRILLAGRHQVFDDDGVHQRAGDVVEHDGRDHHVAAALRLQIAGQEGPQRAKQRRAQHADGDQHPHRQRAVEGQHGERQAQARKVHLAFGADVEQASLHGDRNRQAGEDEGRGVEQRVAQGLGIDDGAVDQDAHRFDWDFAQQVDHQRGHQQGRQQVQDGHYKRGSPAWQVVVIHDLCMPPISKPMRVVSNSSIFNSPVMRPPHMTRIRSASARTSSSSTDTSRIATPESRRASSCVWMLSMVPMSTPRVGWPTSISFGCASTSRAITTFCWLPPESRPIRRSPFAGRTSKVFIKSAQRAAMALKFNRPQRCFSWSLYLWMVLSITEKFLTTPLRSRSSGMWAMPSSRKVRGRPSASVRLPKGRALPRNSTLPDVGSRMPDKISINSLWPLPDTPAMATISPARSVKPISRSSLTCWSSCSCSCCTCSTGAPGL